MASTKPKRSFVATGPQPETKQIKSYTGGYSVTNTTKTTTDTVGTNEATSGEALKAEDCHTPEQGQPSAPVDSMTTIKPKRSFVVTGPPKTKHIKATHIPRAADIQVNDHAGTFGQLVTLPIPDVLARRLGPATEVMGFDVETHDVINNTFNKWRVGDFNWQTTLHEDELNRLRIVQLGWTATAADGKVTIKGYVVQPSNFIITPDATEKHNISHEKAVEKGRPLATVLREFMEDVSESMKRQGRVVAHHIEFDAGLVLRELHRCGLHGLANEWASIAKHGFCTFNPIVGRWIKEASGLEVGERSQPAPGLQQLLRLLVPSSKEQHTPHDAGSDADIARKIYLAIRQCTDATKMAAYIKSEKEKIALTSKFVDDRTASATGLSPT